MSQEKSFAETLACYRQKLVVIEALRRAFAKFKHHAHLTKACVKFIEAELPGRTIYFNGKCVAADAEIAVWGGGLAYEDRVSVALYSVHDASGQRKAAATWQEKFTYNLDREDPSDSIERMEAEDRLAPELEAMEAEIAAIRARADAKCAALGVPRSAKVRSDSVHWEHASYQTQYRFPGLFARDGR